MSAIVTAERAALSVEKAAAMLATCRTVGEVKDIRDKAKAVAVYLRTKKGAAAAQLDAGEIIVRADIRIGQIQRETPKAKGTRSMPNPRAHGGNKKAPPSAPTLADQGLSKRDSATSQRAARVAESPAVVDAFFASARRTGRAPSTAALATLADLPSAKKAIEVIEKSAGRAGTMKAYVRLSEKADTARKIEAEPTPMPSGPFRVIVADPPWAYTKREGDATHRGDLPYPPMTTDAICALEVASIAHEDSILWLWTTNAFMRDAYRVLDAWGFHEKTILTWVKDRIGLGDWLRGQTEHCILAVRGKPTVTLTNQTTRLDGAVREHSRKPDEFYVLVDGLCPGSKVEMFCRTPRPGWARWGAESELFDAAE